MVLCPPSVCTIVIGELVNVTQLHRIPAMSAATVNDAGASSDNTADLMVKKFFRGAGVSAVRGAGC
uniref:Uncharacterized protein n=1 Tax=Anopheles albimanus TaxID=7167 RepID=A0A8W7JLW1_ANOAL